MQTPTPTNGFQISRRQLRDSIGHQGEFDDFNLHNLKDLDTSTKLSLLPRELDIQSTTSSSSTVVHTTDTSSQIPPETFNMVGLNTLETDPTLNTKIQNKLKLNGINSNDYQKQQEDVQEHDTFEEADTTIQSSMHDDSDYLDAIFPSPPSSPPKELDPNKLYALFDFNGPDPSHLELFKDDSVVLLNDSDSYWWLVKRIDDSKVGFAPAEILETYQERLARLNCWKNEIIERGDSGDLSNAQLKLFHTNYEDHVVPQLANESFISIERKGSLKKGRITEEIDIQAKKAVSFADIEDIKEETKSPMKRISDSNFLVKNIEDYNSEDENDEPNVEDLDIGDHGTIQLTLPKTRNPKSNDSIRMLDDLLSSFDDVETNAIVNESSLHPTVGSIFTPLINQVKELDELVQMLDMEHDSNDSSPSSH